MAYSFALGIILEPRLFFPGRGAIVQGLARDLYFLIKFSPWSEYAYWGIRIGLTALVWTIVNIIICQDYCLIYRLTVVLPNQKYHDFLVNRKIVYVTVAFGFLVCFTFAIPFYLFIADEKDIPGLMKIIEKDFPETFIDVKPDSVSFWFNSYSSDFRFIMYLIGGGLFLSEIVCYLCVYATLKILRKNAASFSTRTYKLHRQMTVLLFLQITNPLIFVIFPIAACTAALFFDWYFHHWIGFVGLIFMNFYSISNTILTVSFVIPYRMFTKKYTFDQIMKLPFLKKYQTVIQIVPIDSSTGFTANSHNARNFN